MKSRMKRAGRQASPNPRTSSPPSPERHGERSRGATSEMKTVDLARMRSRTTKGFWGYFARLPNAVQRQATRTFRRWREDPSHPSLAFKRVHTTEPIYSVRITRGYHALGVRDGDLMTWFWIGSHTDYVKDVAQKLIGQRRVDLSPAHTLHNGVHFGAAIVFSASG
jgi:hypothetical protein